MNIIIHPTAYIARGIENVLLSGENSEFLPVKLGYSITARLVSITVFPIFLCMELTFRRIPKLLISTVLYEDPKKKHKTLHKIQKYCLAILCFPLGLLRADAVSGFFLKNPYEKNMVVPFGVGDLYGKAAEIHFPETREDLKGLVQQAKRK